VNHSACRVTRSERETVRIVTPIRLIEFDPVHLNVGLGKEVSQRLIAPIALDQVVKAMRDE
jgi:hypothetical protein